LTSGWTLSIFSTRTTKRPKRQQASIPTEMISHACIVQTHCVHTLKLRSTSWTSSCMKRYRTFPQEASGTSDQDALASEVAYNNIWIQFTYHLRMCRQCGPCRSICEFLWWDVLCLAGLNATCWMLGSGVVPVALRSYRETDRVFIGGKRRVFQWWAPGTRMVAVVNK
jgi:hypothetical protein